MKTIILAGNHKQYSDWLYDNNVLPDLKKLKNYVFGNDVDKIRGIRAKEILVIGTFWEDVKNAGLIFEEAKERIYHINN